MSSREGLRWLALLASLAPAFALATACEDSGSSSGGVFAPEAGPGFEAGPSPEASPPADAGTDVVVVPPAMLGVTVTVTDGTSPLAAVRVILHDATGAVIGQQQTDATGKVIAATAPSMITVLASPGQGSVTPVTFLGVADGDKLAVVVPPNQAGDVLGTYAVTVAPNAVTANASLYEIFVGGVGCYGSSNTATAPISVEVGSACVGAQGQVLARAANAGGPLGFAFAKNVAKPVGGNAVPVATSAFVASGQTTVSATGYPASQTTSSFATLGAIANGALFPIDPATGTIESTGVVFPTPTGFADAYQASAGARTFGSTQSQRGIVRREPTTAPATAALAFDFTTALPALTAATLTQTAPARPDVTLTSATPLTGADLGAVRLSWYDQVASVSGSWTFVVPPTTASFKAPALPADAAMFVPVAGARVDSAAFVDSSLVPGYAQAKALPISTAGGIDALDVQKPLPVAGTLRYTYLNANLD